MEITTHFKQKVRTAIIEASENYGGSAAAYSKSLGINQSVYSRLKKGEIEKILSDSQWITLGREFNVSLKESTWKIARTHVYNEIEGNLQFCQQYSKSMILVDDCGIGKTFCAKHIIRGLKNAFYLDCSQAKTKMQFVRLLARTVGVDNKGKYADVKSDLKYYLNLLEMPLIVLDEAGDLDYNAFLELKELWNGTQGSCAWYMMGAEGLRAKINRGINNSKVGFAEIFSRYSDEFVQLVPNGKEDRTAFYRDLIGTVATANLKDKSQVKTMVNKCLKKESTLRYLDTLIKINQ